MEYKTTVFDFEINEEGIIEGYLTKYYEVDSYGDIVKPGAFDDALKEKKQYPLLWQHLYYEPIGGVTLEEVGDGIKIRGVLDLDVQRAREAYSLYKKGFLKGISYGYDTIKASYKSENRVLEKIKLWEVSLVTFPALEKAEVTYVKQMEHKHVLPLRDLPMVGKDVKWDESEARRNIAKWASSDGSGDKDKINWKKYSMGFLYVEKGEEENITGYKFPYANVFDGELKIVPRAIYAAAAYLDRANISEEDKAKIRKELEKAYRKLGETPPWDKKSYMFKLFIEEMLDNPEELKEVDPELLKKASELFSNVLAPKDDNLMSLTELLNLFQKIKSEVK